MDTPISQDRIQEERAFIRRYIDTIGDRPVQYSTDFAAALQDRPRKVAVVQIPLSEPPELMDVDETPSDNKLNLTVKSLKPSLTFSITASLTDSVAELKSLVAKSSSTAPPVDSQRLLIKGKALADSKLLKEYDISDGATIHLVLKPSSTPAITTTSASPTTSTDPSSSKMSGSASPKTGPTASPGAIASSLPASGPGSASGSQTDLTRPPTMGHHRVPSLTITTDTDDHLNSPGSPLQVVDAPPLGPQAQVSSAAFHQTISDPSFWQKIHALCVGEFAYEGDADAAWETFLVAMKGRLSAGEAAKIRDVVGVKGMGGQ